MTANAVNGFLHTERKWINKNIISPFSILVLNLMPTRKKTELQFLSAFNNLGYDVKITFMYACTHHFKGISKDKVQKNYVCFKKIKKQTFDGLIITGAPVEKIPFKEVDYWQELKKIMEWAQAHVKQKLYECWAAQAGLFYHFGIRKSLLPFKVSGIFTADKIKNNSFLINKLDAGGLLRMPQSRFTKIILNKDHLPGDLDIIVDSSQVGPMILFSKNKHTIYITGHPEYGKNTLAQEYDRDQKKNLPISPPLNYFMEKKTKKINFSWQDSAKKIYQNWLDLIADKKLVRG